MNHTIRYFVAKAILFTTGLATLFAQSEIPIGTMDFGVTPGQSQLSGVVLRARLVAGSTNSEALVTVRVLRGGTELNSVNVAEFTVDTNFSAADSIVAMRVLRIRDDRLVIDSGMSTVTVPANGRVSFTVQKNEVADPTRQRPTFKEVVDNPSGFRVEIQTTNNGILRSELSLTKQAVVAASLKNGSVASATAFLVASVTRNASCMRAAAGDSDKELLCEIVAAQVEGFMAYRYPARTLFSQPRFTGMYASDADGKVVFDALLPVTVMADLGIGQFRYRANIATLDATTKSTLQKMMTGEVSGLTLALYSNSIAAPVMTAKLQTTQRVQLAGPIGAAASSLNPRADAVAFVDLLKSAVNPEEVIAGLVNIGALFTNYPAGTRFTELTLRTGQPTRPGTIVLDSGLSLANSLLVASATGFATGTTVLDDQAGVRTLNGFLADLSDSIQSVFLSSDTRDTIAGRVRPASTDEDGGN